MKLYCRDGIVLATHADDQVVPASSYGGGVMVVPFVGDVSALPRIGPEPAEGDFDNRPRAAPSLDLPTLKDMLCRQVDDAAERIRLTLITPGAGQAMEYQEAQSQATAALAAPGSATAAAYPMLAASIGVDLDPETGEPATDVLGVARSINVARDLWIVIGSEIRRLRLGAKAAIAAAETAEDAHAASDDIAWPAMPPG